MHIPGAVRSKVQAPYRHRPVSVYSDMQAGKGVVCGLPPPSSCSSTDIKWKFLCPAELENCGIPKFTLQPIVENSIVHCDFSHPDFLLSIEIKVFRHENSIYILVSDNGPGIPPEKLRELNTTLSSEHFTHTGSYGLQNCSQRIRLHYGNPYGIVLEHSSKGSCTCVRLPDMQVG